MKLSLFEGKNIYFHIEQLPLANNIIDQMSSCLSDQQLSYAPKRKQEYLAGRYCVKQAFKQVNYEFQSLAMNKDRSPQWPEGFAGSISHTKNLAIGAISESYKSLGLDLEMFMSLERFEKLKHMIASEKEENLVEVNMKIYPTILFSAKESLYKALNPLCKTYFGFLEASILSISNKDFSIELHSENENVSSLNKVYFGGYEILGDKVLTLITIN